VRQQLLQVIEAVRLFRQVLAIQLSTRVQARRKPDGSRRHTSHARTSGLLAQTACIPLTRQHTLLGAWPPRFEMPTPCRYANMNGAHRVWVAHTVCAWVGGQARSATFRAMYAPRHGRQLRYDVVNETKGRLLQVLVQLRELRVGDNEQPTRRGEGRTRARRGVHALRSSSVHTNTSQTTPPATARPLVLVFTNRHNSLPC
jgi:hypothetical protein